MRFDDILRLCAQNMFRRKSRTILTVLGVIVGCCSIVLMISLGAGISEQNKAMLKQMGDLNVITVYKPGTEYGGMGYGATQSGTSSDTENEVKLDDDTLASFKQLPGVVGATGQLTLDYRITMAASNGRFYTDYGVIESIDMAELKSMGYELKEGEAPVRDGEVLVGQYFAYQFMDKFRPEGNNMRQQPYDAGNGQVSQCDMQGNCEFVPADEAVKPFFDPMKTEITVTVGGNDSAAGGTSGSGAMSGTSGSGSGSSDGGNDGTANGTGASGTGNTFKLKATGVLKEDYNKGQATSNGILMDVSQAKAMIAKVDKSAAMKRTSYSQALVKVSDISQVADVEQQIRDMGFSTNSYEQMRKDLEQQSRFIQLMLGGIGAVSLLVAAIGITNTMVMSVTERTREIGIMKALGCYVRDIRMMFLGEAGAIGFLGGVIGCMFSGIISLGINLLILGGFSWEHVKQAIVGGDGVTRLSVIPPWLFIFAILFSMAIGLISGFGPSNKAVSIPALDAIKNEQ
ncbi:ABC transporter permease [Bifidobacterium tissieri]|uniref:FtsX-like permease family protein n=1 Tax=Bifidobacterium tissieri TaxID=1630162 RepID=A0A5M9ZMR2_9BIFI|nr:ABC transporter permease [Bifidobacterium tissieri]KAA8828719.1 FtsX-like permease family protein [Bifidobacterium tissieri]KAA8833345.1 FtsX-like permease family protein [Bifidobacterium tissieri]